MQALYTLLLALMLPLILARLFWRSLQQREYRENIGERFGRYQNRPLKGCIWIHAVSVGEARAAEPLVARLRALYPLRPILVTGMTPTGRAMAKSLFGDIATCVYLPYDFSALHSRLLIHFSPSVLLIMETEIWPNLLHTCQLNAIPALIVNARLSEKSRHGYARFVAIRTLIQHALQSVHVIAAQSMTDAARFRDLGAPAIVVTGNIKFDVTIEPAMASLGKRWRADLGTRQVLLCASTREGEEAMLLEAYLQIFDATARADMLLVIAPRHPQRFERVADDIERAGLRFSRRSRSTAMLMEVLLGDSMGEMAAYYSFCDVVIIGGSFLPLGGQNLIEACASGKPVIMGPSTFNFAEAAQLARNAGAMLPVSDALEAMQTAHRLLQNSALRGEMSVAAFELVDANRGATEKTVALIAPILGAS